MKAQHLLPGRFTMLGALAAISFVAACSGVGISSSSDRVFFDGHYFRAKAKPVDKKVTPTEFTVVVNDVSASLDGAREAGRFEGTKFCIYNFGTSQILWKVGPDTDPQALSIVDDKLTFTGACQRP
ncbi:hypothetical protein [Ruegeria profundi]|nr:hypothetical protein [Ruegeria profundi]